MGDFFTRHHRSYSEPDGTLTVSDNITGFDMKMVLDALAFFNSEDCDYMYQELIGHASDLHDYYGSVTNVFQILQKNMEDALEERAAEDETFDIDDYMLDGYDSLYDNVHSTVDSLAESFEELVKNKVNFVDFDAYPDKIVVREELTEDELSAVDDLVCDLKDCVDVSDVDDNEEMSEVALNLPKVWDNLIAENVENNEDLKTALSKCNFREVLTDYAKNTDLIKWAIYKRDGFDDDSIDDNLDELYSCL